MDTNAEPANEVDRGALTAIRVTEADIDRQGRVCAPGLPRTADGIGSWAFNSAKAIIEAVKIPAALVQHPRRQSHESHDKS
jgi:hypothetical protein